MILNDEDMGQLGRLASPTLAGHKSRMGTFKIRYVDQSTGLTYGFGVWTELVDCGSVDFVRGSVRHYQNTRRALWSGALVDSCLLPPRVFQLSTSHFLHAI